MSNRVYLDLTELVATPLRTGIQRVERELIGQWPGPARLVPARYENGVGLVELAPEILRQLNGPLPTGDDVVNAECQKLAPYLRNARPFDLSQEESALLIPEAFCDPARCSFYEGLPTELKAKTYFLVYDFIPLLQPQVCPPRSARVWMYYLKALRSAAHISFISDQTRREFGERIARRGNHQGPVFPLGGDGLGLEKQSFSSEKRTFAIIGSLEPRKQVAQVIKAFALLWKKGTNVELEVVGRLLSHATEERDLLAALADEPRLHYKPYASDDELRNILRRARATIFVSQLEGFGIPPYESLNAGIPVICCRDGVPSLDLIARSGQIRLADRAPASIARAVETLLDDATARRLWEEATHIAVPTWQGFARQIADWVSGAR